MATLCSNGQAIVFYSCDLLFIYYDLWFIYYYLFCTVICEAEERLPAGPLPGCQNVA